MQIKIKFLFVILIYCNCSKAQDDNTVSLNDLSFCTMKFVVDDADKIISKYGYSFVQVEKAKFQSKDCERYTYKKESNGVMEKIYLYKNSVFDPFDNTLKVMYSSFFNRNFNNYKKELEADTANIFISEKANGDCFDRTYEGVNFNYDFSICKTQYPDNPVYLLIINFNHGAGLLRKRK